MSSKNKQIILIALSVLLVVLFLFMPEQPLETRKEIKAKASTELNPVSGDDLTKGRSIEARVQGAIQSVQSENPMAGIQELLGIVKEDSTQVDAQYYLGLFSVQTGQFEKAVNRFEKVITFAGLKKYPDVRYQLAVCLEEVGNKEASIEQLEVYLTEIDPADSEKVDAVQSEISRLRN